MAESMRVSQTLEPRLWVTCPSCGSRAISSRQTGTAGWLKFQCPVCWSQIIEAPLRVGRRLDMVQAHQLVQSPEGPPVPPPSGVMGWPASAAAPATEPVLAGGKAKKDDYDELFT